MVLVECSIGMWEVDFVLLSETLYSKLVSAMF